MRRHQRILAAVLASLVFLSPAVLAQGGPRPTDAREITHNLGLIKSRLPKLVFEELQAYAQRWERLDWEKRQFLEKCLLLFESMLPHQIREIFKEANQSKGDKQRAMIKETLKKLAEGGEVPAAHVDPSVVVVIVGADVTDPKIGGFTDSNKENLPHIWNDIRPFGAFVPAIKTSWVGRRTIWMGEFLTGVTVNPIIADGNVYKFKIPTMCDLFRKISSVQTRDCWLVSRGDVDNIVYDYLEFDRAFEDRFKPTALTSAKLRMIDGYVQDHILSLRKGGKTAFEIQRGLPLTLTPGMLHLDVDFDNKEVRNFLRDVVAEHGGQPTDSNAFTLRLGVRLLQDPVMAPRLAIFRFGGIPGIDQEKNIGVKRELRSRKMRDDDEACFNLWRAFRSNPYYKRFGTFIVLSEFRGAVFVGPKISVGTAKKPYYLNQFTATIAKILGYEIRQFLRPSKGNPKAKPIKELFE